MIDLVEAKRRAAKLQRQADQVLQHFQFEKLLQELGEVHRIGSYIYGLMVKPDIDYAIYNDTSDYQKVTSVGYQIALMPDIVGVSISNNALVPNRVGFPPSHYLGIKPLWRG